MRRTALVFFALLIFLLPSWPKAQGTSPATPLTLISPQGRRPVPTTVISGQEFVALDDVATLFQVSVREDAQAGGITISYKGRTVVMSPDQPMASVNGRVVSLPSAAIRSGRRWLVPVDFIPRALAPIYDMRLELRRPSRLLLMGPVRVPRVTARIDSAGPPTHATVDLTPGTTVTTAIESDRIVLRVDADALDLALPPAGGGLIDQFRAGDQPTSVVILLSPRSGSPRVSTTTTTSPNPTTTITDSVTHVAIDVTASQADTPAPLPTPQSQAAPAPLPSGEGPLIPAVHSAVQTVVLDPGHGGPDTGARSGGGALEKALTLDVSRRLKTLLETRLGVRVVMTREDDQPVTLDQRSAVANNGKADLFVSLHLNAAPSPAMTGAEVYYLLLDKEGEEARRSAAADEVTLSVLGGGTRPIDVIRWDLAQARHVDASAMMATMVSEELTRRVAMSSRGIQRAPVRVLAGVNMPAVLVEMAYLSNPAQAEQAGTADYQMAVAQAIFDAVVRFRAMRDGARTP